ncbi:MAG TPA: TonB family protein [Pyrinomonadaceae bacterium]|jgi:periplasmic protein TonB|nr:TonB family protein [Pyrinomonadaceae bacterium]
MFDNLVESSSHKDDITRKGSFVGITALIYAVLLVTFFVAGIYWYDARLGDMELELTTLVAPVPVPQQQKEPEKQAEAKPQKVEQNVDIRKELIADVAESRLPPKEISAKASDIPPVRRGVTTMIGNADSNAAAPMPAGPGAGNVVTAPAKIDIGNEPPPPEAPKPTPPRAPISGGVLNGKAISLPKPAYPPIARAAHASGTVVVQVTIDENGNVIAAHAVSGHPLLQGAAVGAARQAKFSPTKLSGQPVKVTGVIQYNFVAQ